MPASGSRVIADPKGPRHSAADGSDDLHRAAGLLRPRFLYGTSGQDYPDNPERFAFLAHAALEWAASASEAFRRRSHARLAGRSRSGAAADRARVVGARRPACRLHHPQPRLPGCLRCELAAATWAGMGFDAHRRARILGANQLSQRRADVQPHDHNRQPALFARNSDAGIRVRIRRHPAVPQQ